MGIAHSLLGFEDCADDFFSFVFRNSRGRFGEQVLHTPDTDEVPKADHVGSGCQIWILGEMLDDSHVRLGLFGDEGSFFTGQPRGLKVSFVSIWYLLHMNIVAEGDTLDEGRSS